MPHSPELTLPRELLARLRERYAESHRHYHSIGHIAYADAVRCEYAWVAEADYRLGRAAVLRRFIDRQPIYHTPALLTAWEAAARDNLRQELGRLAAPS